MYDRILFPTDGSEGSTAVFGHVLDIAESSEATLHVLNVADTTRDSVTRIGRDVVDVLEREGEQIVGELVQRGGDRGVSTVPAVHQGGVPETITAYASEHDVDVVVMPTHGRTGPERLLLGSVTERVMRQSSVPVLTVRPGDTSVRYPYRNVLVATDGSECAAKAVDRAADIASATGTRLHVLSVVDVASLGIDVHSELQVEALEEQAGRVVADATDRAERAGVDSVVERVEHGTSVYTTINDYVDENNVDIVVIGTRGRTGIDRYLLGSVAEKTVRTAPVPVLTVPVTQADSPDS